MDAVKYFEEKARMTKRCGIKCGDCGLSSCNNSVNALSCTVLEYDYPEEAVAIVEK